MQRHQPAKI